MEIDIDEESVTIDITPTWDTAVRLYLEVIRVNGWWSEPNQSARKEILHMAEALDKINKYVREELEKNNDSIK